MKLLITGGHLTPALAFIDFVLSQHQHDEIVFVGRLYSKSNHEQLSQEANEVRKRGVYFIAFETGKLVLNKPVELIKNTFLLTVGSIHAFFIIAKKRPDAVLSFGGYLAVPLAYAAWLWGIPVITHEQTHSLGIANKLIERIATKVALSYPESKPLVESKKAVVTGNIIRSSVLINSQTKPQWFTGSDQKPILYVTGGSQGSEVINATILQSLKSITKDWVVIHQCGASTSKRNYLAELQQAKKTLPRTQQTSYFVREWISEEELAWIYTVSYGVVARSGANTTEEIARRALPCIFIPLPFSHNAEQLENAKALVEEKMALLLPQKNLNPTTLLESLAELRKTGRALSNRLKQLNFKKDASQRLYDLVAKATKA